MNSQNPSDSDLKWMEGLERRFRYTVVKRRNKLTRKWSLMSAAAIGLFWLIWYFFTGEMPEVSEIETIGWNLSLPFGIPRWTDIFFGPLYSFLLIQFFTEKRINQLRHWYYLSGKLKEEKGGLTDWELIYLSGGLLCGMLCGMIGLVRGGLLCGLINGLLSFALIPAVLIILSVICYYCIYFCIYFCIDFYYGLKKLKPALSWIGRCEPAAYVSRWLTAADKENEE